MIPSISSFSFSSFSAFLSRTDVTSANTMHPVPMTFQTASTIIAITIFLQCQFGIKTSHHHGMEWANFLQSMSCHVQISCHCTKEPCHSRPFLVAFVRHGRQSMRLFSETARKFLQRQVSFRTCSYRWSSRCIASIKLQESECAQLVGSLCGLVLSALRLLVLARNQICSIHPLISFCLCSSHSWWAKLR